MDTISMTFPGWVKTLNGRINISVKYGGMHGENGNWEISLPNGSTVRREKVPNIVFTGNVEDQFDNLKVWLEFHKTDQYYDAVCRELQYMQASIRQDIAHQKRLRLVATA